jgi:hypothetical protein
VNRRRIQSSFRFAGCCAGILAVAFMAAALGWAQAPASTSGADSTPAPASTPYQPKFQGDPAHSDSEAQALGYMRVVIRAQREYKKRHDKYATSLEALAGTGSFTKRMAHSTNRGDYTVSFTPRHESAHHAGSKNAGGKNDDDGFILTMTPNHMDADHRSFYAEDDGIIHADDQKPADQDSPKIK